MYAFSLKLPNILAKKCSSDLKNALFVSQEGVIEHFFGLVQQHLFVLIARRIVAQQELSGSGIACHLGSLTGCGMTVFLS